MSLFSDIILSVFERRYRSEPIVYDVDDCSLVELVDVLMKSTGDPSGLVTARKVLDRFETLEDPKKLEFFRYLATDMDIDPQQVRSALDAYELVPDRSTYREFATAVEPPRQEMIRRLNRVPGATRALVNMRADLLRLGKKQPELQPLDLDFLHLFSSWFNSGFLVLRPITWESPAQLLERVIAHEAVHSIESWDDLQRRLEPADRRCFAFFHPSLPDDPLIFVEVALGKGIPVSVQALLAESRQAIQPEEADTAVFYSISNCQPGLAGVSFGNTLIKQVVSDLSSECLGLKTFVTLSPIPGLTQWLKKTDLELDIARPEYMKSLSAHYLLTAKNSRGLPVDPVARFHLGNGAIVHAVHADADISDNGRAQSGGAMVNYLYDLPTVAQNHEKFATSYQVVASDEVRALADMFSSETIRQGNTDDQQIV